MMNEFPGLHGAMDGKLWEPAVPGYDQSPPMGNQYMEATSSTSDDMAAVSTLPLYWLSLLYPMNFDNNENVL